MDHPETMEVFSSFAWGALEILAAPIIATCLAVTAREVVRKVFTPPLTITSSTKVIKKTYMDAPTAPEEVLESVVEVLQNIIAPAESECTMISTPGFPTWYLEDSTSPAVSGYTAEETVLPIASVYTMEDATLPVISECTAEKSASFIASEHTAESTIDIPIIVDVPIMEIPTTSGPYLTFEPQITGNISNTMTTAVQAYNPTNGTFQGPVYWEPNFVTWDQLLIGILALLLFLRWAMASIDRLVDKRVNKRMEEFTAKINEQLASRTIEVYETKVHDPRCPPYSNTHIVEELSSTEVSPVTPPARATAFKTESSPKIKLEKDDHAEAIVKKEPQKPAPAIPNSTSTTIPAQAEPAAKVTSKGIKRSPSPSPSSLPSPSPSPPSSPGPSPPPSPSPPLSPSPAPSSPPSPNKDQSSSTPSPSKWKTPATSPPTPSPTKANSPSTPTPTPSKSIPSPTKPKTPSTPTPTKMRKPSAPFKPKNESISK